MTSNMGGIKLRERQIVANIRKGLGWGLYDIGNSGYYLVYPLYLFPVYLSERVFPGNPHFELYWGVAQGAAVLLAVVAGIWLGGRLDARGLRRVAPPIIAVTPVTAFLLPGLVALGCGGIVLLSGYVVVHSLYLLSLTVYDASLTGVATRGEERATVSGWAWGWGYLGGLVCLAVMEVGLRFYPRYSGWDFGVGTTFYLVVSLFAARWLRRGIKVDAIAGTATLDSSKTHEQVAPWRLLLMMMLIVDGITVFMSFTGLYGTRVLQLPERQMTSMLALLQVLAFPLTGVIASLGAKNVPRALLMCGLGWLGTVTLLVSVGGLSGMLATIVLVSTVVGTTQALLRALYADVVPTHRAIEGFGRYAVVEKGAAFVGPVIAGILIPYVGYKPVLLVAGLMILLGSVFIWRWYYGIRIAHVHGKS